MWGIWKESGQIKNALRDSRSNLPLNFLIENLVQLKITKPNLPPFSGNYKEFQVCNLYSNSFLVLAYFATYMFQLSLFPLTNTYFSLGMMYIWSHSLSFLRYFSEVLESTHSLNFYWVLDVILGVLHISENRTEKDPCH